MNRRRTRQWWCMLLAGVLEIDDPDLGVNGVQYENQQDVSTNEYRRTVSNLAAYARASRQRTAALS